MNRVLLRFAFALFLLCTSLCAWAFPDIGEDEALDEYVNTKVEYFPFFSEPQWMVGGTYMDSPRIPGDVWISSSNNNVALGYHEKRLYMAWRTAPKHFASDTVQMHILSSDDLGKTWQLEHSIDMGNDLREPFFLSYKGKLHFYYVELGTDIEKFEPRHVWQIERLGPGEWSVPVLWGRSGEIPWEFKVRKGQAWVTSYYGNHYQGGESNLTVEFKSSSDGEHWTAGDTRIYNGGVSEVAFEFDQKGELWAVTRNEDGDESGYGSHVAHATESNYWNWDFPSKSNPRRYDSPRMFRHGKDLYLIARRDVGGIFDDGLKWMPRDLRRLLLWYQYWRRPKRTALYKVDTKERLVKHIVDLPSAGDTAFPSILRLEPHRYLIANYTSPLKYPGRSWVWGQVSPQGTQIYFTKLEFMRQP